MLELDKDLFCQTLIYNCQIGKLPIFMGLIFSLQWWVDNIKITGQKTGNSYLTCHAAYMSRAAYMS